MTIETLARCLEHMLDDGGGRRGRQRHVVVRHEHLVLLVILAATAAAAQRTLRVKTPHCHALVRLVDIFKCYNHTTNTTIP